MRELLPTANIARSREPSLLSVAPVYLEDVSFANPQGAMIGVGDALRTSHTDGIVVSHRGRIVFEWYAHGLTPDSQHLIFSVSKSIAGTLGGILVDKGKLDPDAPVISYIPEMEGSVYGGACTVRHLLDMSVGIRFDEDYMARDGDVMNYRRSTGWEPPDPSVPPTNLRDYLKTLRPNGAPHGHTFHYVSTNTDVLGWVYERACGISYAKILSQYLWQPMGAEHDAYISVDSRGAARVAGGICASLRDLARFGEMMRNHGVSNARQVVPSWWIDDIRHNGNAEASVARRPHEGVPERQLPQQVVYDRPQRGAICRRRHPWPVDLHRSGQRDRDRPRVLATVADGPRSRSHVAARLPRDRGETRRQVLNRWRRGGRSIAGGRLLRPCANHLRLLRSLIRFELSMTAACMPAVRTRQQLDRQGPTTNDQSPTDTTDDS
ncbi:beta-lactamase family protein [Bradyrhizobium sp. ISRA435]|nr:beta-lactamase family protein [Bradyrhizobium sp. ISRA435]